MGLLSLVVCSCLFSQSPVFWCLQGLWDWTDKWLSQKKEEEEEEAEEEEGETHARTHKAI